MFAILSLRPASRCVRLWPPQASEPCAKWNNAGKMWMEETQELMRRVYSIGEDRPDKV